MYPYDAAGASAVARAGDEHAGEQAFRGQTHAGIRQLAVGGRRCVGQQLQQGLRMRLGKPLGEGGASLEQLRPGRIEGRVGQPVDPRRQQARWPYAGL